MHTSCIDLARRLTLATALASSFGAPAIAADTSAENVVVFNTAHNADSTLVPTTGLDLHSKAGAAGLHHRVRIAAVQLCGALMPGDSLTSDATLACAEESVYEAKPQMDRMIASAKSGSILVAAGPIVP